MTSKLAAVGFALSALNLGACTTDIDDTPDDGIDQALLGEYREALPGRSQLLAAAPQASATAALGEPALYPAVSRDVVTGINGAVESTVDLLDLITSTPPTVYNSATREFVWGPYPDDIGFTAAYIRETDPGEDFRYEFAFARGATNDLAGLTPIIGGGATPDPDNDDYGIGVVMWDLTALDAFHAANDPGYDPSDYDRGRFVALFGAGPDDTDPDAELAFVVAVFRNFVPRDDQVVEPIDLDYLYGRYATSEHTIDFIDFEANVDVIEEGDGMTEALGVRMAFLDEGTGRAEVDAAGGSVADGDTIEIVECWDITISETYLDLDGQTQLGDPTGCGMFQPSLDELNVPSLDDMDPALLAIMDSVAQSGF